MTRSWNEIRDTRLSAPEARAGYASARAAYEFGQRVKTCREEGGLTQKELARAVHTSQSAIARLEAGGTQPTLQTMLALSKALGASWVIGPDGVTISPPATDQPAVA